MSAAMTGARRNSWASFKLATKEAPTPPKGKLQTEARVGHVVMGCEALSSDVSS